MAVRLSTDQKLARLQEQMVGIAAKQAGDGMRFCVDPDGKLGLERIPTSLIARLFDLIYDYFSDRQLQLKCAYFKLTRKVAHYFESEADFTRLNEFFARYQQALSALYGEANNVTPTAFPVCVKLEQQLESAEVSFDLGLPIGFENRLADGIPLEAGRPHYLKFMLLSSDRIQLRGVVDRVTCIPKTGITKNTRVEIDALGRCRFVEEAESRIWMPRRSSQPRLEFVNTSQREIVLSAEQKLVRLGAGERFSRPVGRFELPSFTTTVGTEFIGLRLTKPGQHSCVLRGDGAFLINLRLIT
jgi:hypothetical protein